MRSDQPFVILAGGAFNQPLPTSRHKITRKLSKKYPVLFIENTPMPADLLKGKDAPGNMFDCLRGLRRIDENLMVATPPPFRLYPDTRIRSLDTINQRLLAGWLDRVLKKLGWDQPIIWSFQYNSGNIFKLTPNLLSVFHRYDLVADLGLPFSKREVIAAVENHTIDQADLVFTPTSTLAELSQRLNSNTIQAIHGVDLDLYSAKHIGKPPKQIGDIPRPRVGFVGAIEHWVDLQLIKQAATALPDISFVLIGPTGKNVEAVAADNIHLTGRLPHEIIPSAIAALDVCLLPFKVNNLTRSACPLKLLEYLAAGKPVVSTSLPAAKEFCGPVLIAENQEDYVDQIKVALNNADNLAAPARTAVANLGWDQRVASMLQVIDDRLEKRDLPQSC